MSLEAYANCWDCRTATWCGHVHACLAQASPQTDPGLLRRFDPSHEALIAALQAIVDDAIPLSGDDAGADSVGCDLISHARVLLAGQS